MQLISQKKDGDPELSKAYRKHQKRGNVICKN